MVKYTRRHFQDIAALIASVPKSRRNAEIEKYCNLFAANNPAFDRKKFAAACGVTNPKTLGKFGNPAVWERKTENKKTTWRNKNTGAKASVVKDRNAGGFPGYIIEKEGRGMAGFTITGKKKTAKDDLKQFMTRWEK